MYFVSIFSFLSDHMSMLALCLCKTSCLHSVYCVCMCMCVILPVRLPRARIFTTHNICSISTHNPHPPTATLTIDHWTLNSHTTYNQLIMSALKTNTLARTVNALFAKRFAMGTTIARARMMRSTVHVPTMRLDLLIKNGSFKKRDH